MTEAVLLGTASELKIYLIIAGSAQEFPVQCFA
jgi:hypothetical protein